jgi:hypothetical protein
MRSFWKLERARWVAGALLTLAVGCGSPEEESAAPSATNHLRLLAVDLSGSDVSLKISALRPVSLDVGVAPMDSLGGHLMLVSYGPRGLHQAVPFRLPRFAHLEGRDDRGIVGRKAEVADATATLFLDASEPLERIEVLDEAGTLLAEASAAELESILRSFAGASTRLTAEDEATPMGRLESAFPHIRFLDPAAGDDLALVYSLPGSSVDELVSIDATAADALIEALNRVPAPALGAIRSVGVADIDPESGVIGVSMGSSLLVSSLIVTDRKELIETVVHEATHNFQFLVDGDLSTALWNPDAWPSDVREAAAKTIAKHRLAAGLTTAWEELHESGVELELVDPYTGDDWQDLDDDLAVYGGFVSPYGSTSADEDMAEYVGRLLVPENGGESLVCGRLRTAPTPFPIDLAVPYAKIKFLEALGLLDESVVHSCAGSPAIEGPKGIHLGDAVSFTSSLKAGWLDQDGGRFLAVLGEGRPYRCSLRVLAPDEQALGLHRLDDIGSYNLNDANNAFYLSHDEEDLRARVSKSGLVLVTAVNADLVEGAVFMLTLQNAAGVVTDSFALSTFSIPSP